MSSESNIPKVSADQADLFANWARLLSLNFPVGDLAIQDAMNASDASTKMLTLIDELAFAGNAKRPLSGRRPDLVLPLGRWKSKQELLDAYNRTRRVECYDAGMFIRSEGFELLAERVIGEFFFARVSDLSDSRCKVTTSELLEMNRGKGFGEAPHESPFEILLANRYLPPDNLQIVFTRPVPNFDGHDIVLSVVGPMGDNVVMSCEVEGKVWGPDTPLWLYKEAKTT